MTQPRTRPTNIDPRFILAAVAAEYGFTTEELTRKGRRLSATHARQLVAYIVHVEAGRSYRETGALINRDHATATAAVNKIRDWTLKDPAEASRALDAVWTRAEGMRLPVKASEPQPEAAE